MNAPKPRKWLGPALLLAGVALVGTGAMGILRVSLSSSSNWLAVILPTLEVLAGTVLLFIPLLRRLAREAAEDDTER
ncbi:MAG TPA: hypothetical protein VGS20_02880 [Candidatus Acidoferrales bacterium]|nr:hypothetical protein [Candidatus Acidoferrales bacterium]